MPLGAGVKAGEFSEMSRSGECWDWWTSWYVILTMDMVRSEVTKFTYNMDRHVNGS